MDKGLSFKTQAILRKTSYRQIQFCSENMTQVIIQVIVHGGSPGGRRGLRWKGFVKRVGSKREVKEW